MTEVVLGVSLFTAIILALVGIILYARSKLVSTRDVTISINADSRNDITVTVGSKLAQALAQQGIFLPSACGGYGTCGQCRIKVLEGGGDILATELTHISRKEARAGYRLPCQVPVKRDMRIEIPPEIFEVKKWECTVRSNNNVTSFIKEVVLELPPREEVPFRAGGYIQIECPPHKVDYKTFDIGEEFRSDWDKYNLWHYKSFVKEKVTRAYSMANYPGEKGIIVLNVRIALPPPRMPNVPPGIVSSYIFGLKPGDKVAIIGPYGSFFARETDKEMILVGGGSGMASMRSHIFDQLKRLHTKRKISFWYGARSKKEMFYVNDFDALQAEFDNFEWHIALSEPFPEDNWTGYTGFIHQVLYNNYLKDHPAPEDCEYYLCGPPLMMSAVINMLLELGVETEDIMFDEF
jgi:Na+-transporting NADH:ubiquinone oxidoreductase subunit F